MNVPRAKQWILWSVLALAGLWPFVHRALVPKYELNPWKFGGWAMYTTPTPPVQVALFKIVGREKFHVPEDTLSSDVVSALDDFRKRRHAVGLLARPDAVAEAVFEAPGDLDLLLVLIQRMTLDHETALTTSSKDDYWYEREVFERTGAASRQGVVRELQQGQRP